MQSFNGEFDPEHVEMEDTAMNNELKNREKQILKIAFDYVKRFNLDKTLISNCIFHRQFKAFKRAFFVLVSNVDDASSREIFHQLALRIMNEGGKRAQKAILTYLQFKNSCDDAIELAIKAKIPQEDWPHELNLDDTRIMAAKDAVKTW